MTRGAAEIASFVSAVSRGTAISPNGADGLSALAIAEAAVRSVREGRKILIAEVLA